MRKLYSYGALRKKNIPGGLQTLFLNWLVIDDYNIYRDSALLLRKNMDIFALHVIISLKIHEPSLNMTTCKTMIKHDY